MLSEKGVPPNLNKTAASIKDKENLLGMVNYPAKFTPNLSRSHRTYERSSKKDSEPAWDCAKDSAF